MEPTQKNMCKLEGMLASNMPAEPSTPVQSMTTATISTTKGTI